MFAVSIAILSALAADAPPLGTLMEAGHWKRARALAQARLAQNGNDAEALWAMARVKAAFRDLNGALPLAEKAVKLDPGKAAYHRDLSDILGSEAERASVLRQFGLAKRLKKELETAVSLDPRDLDSLEGLMLYLWQAPGIVGGSKERARQLPEQIGKLDAARGLLAQARVAGWEKDWPKVDALYHKAVEANPRSYRALTTLAGWCESSHPARSDEAEKYARMAVAVAPDRAWAYSLLVRVYAARLRLKELDAILAEAERNVPDNFAPYFAAGEALVAKGAEYARAEGHLRKYLSQEPEARSPSEGIARWRLGQALERQGRTPEARAELEKAVRLEPKQERIRRELEKVGKKN